MSYLGQRTAYGTKSLWTNPLGPGNWTVCFTTQDLAISVEFEVYHIAVSGPPSSNFQVWIDSTFYDYAVRGDINSWDPSQPMIISPGHNLYFHWNVGTGAAPKVTVFCRTESVF